MQTVDPSLKFIAVGDNDMDWNRTVLRIAGANIDYLAIHHYYGRNEMAGDPLNLMARPLFYERFYGKVDQLIRQLVPKRSIKLAINEWGLGLPEGRLYSMESALYGARLMNVFERANDLVGMSAVSDLVNGWPGGIIQAGRHSVFVSPIYLVNQIYSAHLGTERLAVNIDCPTFDSSKEGKHVPYLDAVVSRSADGRNIFIKAVNTHPTRDLTTVFEVAGVVLAPRAELDLITAESMQVSNDFARPDAVSMRYSTVRVGRSFVAILPKHSVSVITLKVEKTGL
jgi:alpha-N-arabinofuranosidase